MHIIRSQNQNVRNRVLMWKPDRNRYHPLTEINHTIQKNAIIAFLFASSQNTTTNNEQNNCTLWLIISNTFRIDFMNIPNSFIDKYQARWLQTILISRFFQIINELRVCTYIVPLITEINSELFFPISGSSLVRPFWNIKVHVAVCCLFVS